MDLERIFTELNAADYRWEAKNPEQLRRLRQNPSHLRPLEKYFGLGVSSLTSEDLLLDGLSQTTLDELAFTPGHSSPFAISGASAVFESPIYSLHSHWPPQTGQEDRYTHLSSESCYFIRKLEQELSAFMGKKVLDLGCGSGALGLSVAPAARQVVGLDICASAISLAQKTAQAYGFKHCSFITYEVPQKPVPFAPALQADVVLMNPPFAMPTPGVTQPHRDGGKYGLEIPLRFLDFAALHLQEGGELFTTFTNPILTNGTELLWESLRQGPRRNTWDVVHALRVHPHFNQKIAKKDRYADAGLERIELWHLLMQKKVG